MPVLRALFVVFMVLSVVFVPPAMPSNAAAGSAAGPALDPTVSGAKKKARETGQSVEIGSIRGESRQVHAEPDGTLRSTQYIKPRWARKDGRWAAIDTTLQRRADGTIQPVASTADIKIGNGGDGPFVAVGRAGRHLSLTWPGNLPTPVLEGDTARYREVLPGADLLVRAFEDGISHLLEIKTRQAAANPVLDRLDIVVGGRLKAVEVAGGLAAKDPAGGGTVLESAQPLMWDSTGTTQPGTRSIGDDQDASDGPADGSKVADIDAEVSGNTLSLTPDQELLDAGDTTFPVYVDPQWRTKKATAWTMVSSGYPNTEYWKFKARPPRALADVS